VRGRSARNSYEWATRVITRPRGISGYRFFQTRGWRIHWVSCMRPTNTRNVSVTASYPWPVLVSLTVPQGGTAEARAGVARVNRHTHSGQK